MPHLGKRQIAGLLLLIGGGLLAFASWHPLYMYGWPQFDIRTLSVAVILLLAGIALIAWGRISGRR